MKPSRTCEHSDERPEMAHPLFEERTPVSAAIQLALVLAWLAECELATLEWLRLTKSSSKRELRRHESICATLVYHCADLKVPPRGLLGRHCSRLAVAMQEPIGVLLERITAEAGDNLTAVRARQVGNNEKAQP